MVKALDCGVRGHRFDRVPPTASYREGFLPGFSPGIFPPDRRGLNISHIVLPVQSCPSGKNNLKKNKQKTEYICMYVHVGDDVRTMALDRIHLAR